MDNYKEFPKEIMIEATNLCNHKCFFCGSRVSDRKRGMMDCDTMLKTIEEAYNLGVRKISFHCMGEPFICEDTPLYIKKAKELGYTYIYLDTNGVIADFTKTKAAVDAGLDSLKFSIHATTPETFEKITGSKEYYTVEKNFFAISEYIRAQKKNCKLIAYMAESTLNTHESEAFREKYSKAATEIWVLPIHNGSGTLNVNAEYSVSDNFATMKSIPCVDLNRMIIGWDGSAMACSTDWSGQLIYGNIKDNSLEELWNNEKIRRIRKQHENVDTLCDICKKCVTAQ